jgi:hypothetical protein
MYKHYSLLLGVVDNYYIIGKKEKAQNVALELLGIFKDNLKYYSKLNYRDSKSYYDEIGTDLLMYGNILETTTKYDKTFAEKQLDDALNVLPFRMYRTEGLALTAIESYYKLGKKEKAQTLSRKLVASYTEFITEFADNLTKNKGKVTDQEVIAQFDIITPTIDFYKYVRAENKGKDSIFEKELNKGFDDIFKLLEAAMD